MLQELQTKVAMLADNHITMDVRVDATYIMADITVTDEKNNMTDFIHEYFWPWRTETQHDEIIIELNAFFASKCITTVTGVESPICLN